MEFPKRLRQLRLARGLSQTELGKLFNLSKQAISSYETGSSTPSPDTLKRMAKFFGVSLDYLTGESNDPRTPEQLLQQAGAFSADEVNQVPIPVYGIIRAGAPLVAYEDFQGYILAEREKADFALRVRGDSMDESIPPGALILVKRQDWLNYGDIGVIWVRDEDGVTIKRYLPQDGLVVLQPESRNPRHKAKAYKEDEIRILGKVVEVRWRTD